MFEKGMNVLRNTIVSLKRLNNETETLALGALLSKQQFLMNSTNINDYEFKIFSPNC